MQKSTFKRPQTPKMGRRSIAIFASALQNGSHFIDEGKRGSTAHLPSRKLDENDLGFQRIEEPKIKKPSPRSTPALRHKLTPVPIPIPPHQVQKYTPASEEHLSPELQECQCIHQSMVHIHSLLAKDF
ncbi:disks large homolog 5-like [Lacerta agilis]|uniref:disks large homolog 5-like n=1 Tax=Lacerta agilis TaxID=80427 RepID=UPI001419A9D1|nr:disks large homolog 5-like [Lacerta agilis]